MHNNIGILLDSQKVDIFAEIVTIFWNESKMVRKELDESCIFLTFTFSQEDFQNRNS